MFIFDFDGVLIDSVKEAGLSAYNSVTGQLCTDLKQMPEPCFNLYFKNIMHFHNPYTLTILIKWCLENYKESPDRLLTREEFKEFAKTLDINPIEVTPYFFSVREKFISADLSNWLKLNEPYNPLWSKLANYCPEKVIILTAKNKNAVVSLCSHYGLNVLEENIYSGDGNLTKMDNLKTIHARFKLPKYDFIDDHLKNLSDLDNEFKSCPDFHLNLILCDWGYGDKADMVEAKNLGFKVMSQEEVVVGVLGSVG